MMQHLRKTGTVSVFSIPWTYAQGSGNYSCALRLLRQTVVGGRGRFGQELQGKS